MPAKAQAVAVPEVVSPEENNKILASRGGNSLLDMIAEKEALKFESEIRARKKLGELVEQDIEYWYELAKAFVEKGTADSRFAGAANVKGELDIRGRVLITIFDRIMPSKRETRSHQTVDGQGIGGRGVTVLNFEGVNRGTEAARERAEEHQRQLRGNGSAKEAGSATDD